MNNNEDFFPLFIISLLAILTCCIEGNSEDAIALLIMVLVVGGILLKNEK